MFTIFLLLHLATIYFYAVKFEWLEARHNEIYFDLKKSREKIFLVIIDDRLRVKNWIRRHWIFLVPIFNLFAYVTILIPTINAYKEKTIVINTIKAIGMEVYKKDLKTYL